MKLLFNLLEIAFQLTATLLVSIFDKEKDHFFITNSKDSTYYSPIKSD